jgi:hypothetical protein
MNGQPITGEFRRQGREAIRPPRRQDETTRPRRQLPRKLRAEPAPVMRTVA